MDKILSSRAIYNFMYKSDVELNEKEKEQLSCIFESADKHDLEGNPEPDFMITGDEYESFKSKLLAWKNRYGTMFKDFIKQFEAKISEPEVLANNIYANYDSALIPKYLKNLNSDNLLQVLDEYYEINKNGHFFDDIARAGRVEDEQSFSQVKNKLKELSSFIVDYAKSNNINTKDYETRIHDAIEKDNFEIFGLTMDRLYTRVALALGKNSEITVNNRKMELVEPNGKIDANFAQGSTGDCWFLSAIRAAANNEQGLEKLNNMITVNKDSNGISSVSVKVQDKTYEIDYEELKGANEYATGDLDVRALEIAVNRYLHERFELDDISEGRPSVLGFEYLFGKEKVEIQEFDKINDDYFNAITQGNQMSTLETQEPLAAVDDNGEIVVCASPHVLNPIGIEGNDVVFYDPWNSGKRLRIHKKVLVRSDVEATIARFR